MENYIINFSLFLAVFWGLYLLLFRKETFFNHNRLYLLLAPVLAAVLPFIFIAELDFSSSDTVYWNPVSPLFLTESAQTTTLANQVNPSTSFQFGFTDWLVMAYLIGVVCMLFIFVRKLVQYKKLKDSARIEKTNNGVIHYLSNSKTAFTFLNSIFIGEDLNREEQTRILLHEYVHKEQKHSFDLIYYELLKIIFWFHPAVYSLQNQIRLVHEYIADDAVVKNVPKKIYYENLLNEFFGAKRVSFTSQFFNHSLIKKRIIMLQKSKSSSLSKMKYFILLPLIGLMLTYVSCSENAENLDTNSSEQAKPPTPPIPPNPPSNLLLSDESDNYGVIEVENIDKLTDEENRKFRKLSKKIIEDQVMHKLVITDGESIKVYDFNEESNIENEGITFSEIETVPAYPGCDQSEPNDKVKKCTSNKIKEFVNANFNTDLGKKLDLEGVNRVYVRFTIGKDGVIKDVQARAPHPDLQEEAVRVVKSLPKMQPGKQDGKPVNVLYSLPIVFQIN